MAFVPPELEEWSPPELDGSAEIPNLFPSSPKAESALGSFARRFATDIAPAVGTAGAGLGAGLLAIESGPGAIAADIAAGTAGHYATRKAQEALMGEEAVKANEAQLASNAREHPVATQFGGMVPFLISLLGGGGGATVKAGEKVLGKAITGSGKKAVISAAEKEAPYVAPLVERMAHNSAAFARGGGAIGEEEADKTGDLSHIPDEIVKNALMGGAVGIFPEAKGILEAATGKTVKDIAAMTFASHIYDAAVHGKPVNWDEIKNEVVGDYPAFALQNAVMMALSRGKAHMPLPKEGEAQSTEGQRPPSLDPNDPNRFTVVDGWTPPEVSPAMNSALAFLNPSTPEVSRGFEGMTPEEMLKSPRGADYLARQLKEEEAIRSGNADRAASGILDTGSTEGDLLQDFAPQLDRPPPARVPVEPEQVLADRYAMQEHLAKGELPPPERLPSEPSHVANMAVGAEVTPEQRATRTVPGMEGLAMRNDDGIWVHVVNGRNTGYPFGPDAAKALEDAYLTKHPEAAKKATTPVDSGESPVKPSTEPVGASLGEVAKPSAVPTLGASKDRSQSVTNTEKGPYSKTSTPESRLADEEGFLAKAKANKARGVSYSDAVMSHLEKRVANAKAEVEKAAKATVPHDSVLTGKTEQVPKTINGLPNEVKETSAVLPQVQKDIAKEQKLAEKEAKQKEEQAKAKESQSKAKVQSTEAKVETKDEEVAPLKKEPKPKANVKAPAKAESKPASSPPDATLQKGKAVSGAKSRVEPTRSGEAATRAQTEIEEPEGHTRVKAMAKANGMNLKGPWWSKSENVQKVVDAIKSKNTSSLPEGPKRVANDIINKKGPKAVAEREEKKAEVGKAIADQPDDLPENAPKELGYNDVIQWANKVALDEYRSGNAGLNRGLNPKLLAAHAIRSADWIKTNGEKFVEWSKSMLKEFGHSIQRHLNAIWKAAKQAVADGTMKWLEKTGGIKYMAPEGKPQSTEAKPTERVPAGGPFHLSIPSLSKTTKGWELAGKPLSKMGDIQTAGLKAIGQLKDGEIELYKKLVPEAFTGESVNVPKLMDGLQKAGPQVEVHTYGQSGKINEAKEEFDKMTHEWFDNLSSSQKTQVNRFMARDPEYNVSDFSTEDMEKLSKYSDLWDKKTKASIDGNGPKATSYYNSISPFDTKKYPVIRVDVTIPHLWSDPKLQEIGRKSRDNEPLTPEELRLFKKAKATGSSEPLWTQDNLHENLPNTLGWAMAQVVPHPKTGEPVLFVGELQSRWAQTLRGEAEKMKAMLESITQGREVEGQGFQWKLRDEFGGADSVIAHTKEEAIEKINKDRGRGSLVDEGHPLLDVHQPLVLKAVIAEAQKRGIKKVAISDGETAMMTEMHDTNAQPKYEKKHVGKWVVENANDQYPGVGKPYETKAEAEKFMKSLEEGAKVPHPEYGEVIPSILSDYHVHQVTEADTIPKVDQEGGMRLAYDTTLPSIAKKLTGDKGEMMDFGVHKNGHETTERELFATEDQAKAKLAEVGKNGVLTMQKISKPVDGTPKPWVLQYTLKKGSPVFKGEEGKPKSNVTARVYDLSNLDRHKATQLFADPFGFQLVKSSLVIAAREAGNLGRFTSKLVSQFGKWIARHAEALWKAAARGANAVGEYIKGVVQAAAGADLRDGATAIDEAIEKQQTAPTTGQPVKPVVQSDVAYLAAVERGDMGTAERIMDEASEKFNPESKAIGPWMHQSDVTGITEFDANKNRQAEIGFGTYFGKGFSDGAFGKGAYKAYLNLKNPYPIDGSFAHAPVQDRAMYDRVSAWLSQKFQLTAEEAAVLQRASIPFNPITRWGEFKRQSTAIVPRLANIKNWTKAEVLENLHAATGHDGVITTKGDRVAVAWFPNQIKSADPVTRDAQGNVIPPSKRFDASSNNILYMDATGLLLAKDIITTMARQASDVSHFTAKMVRKFGEWVKPHVQEIWTAAAKGAKAVGDYLKSLVPQSDAAKNTRMGMAQGTEEVKVGSMGAIGHTAKVKKALDEVKSDTVQSTEGPKDIPLPKDKGIWERTVGAAYDNYLKPLLHVADDIHKNIGNVYRRFGYEENTVGREAQNRVDSIYKTLNRIKRKNPEAGKFWVAMDTKEGRPVAEAILKKNGATDAEIENLRGWWGPDGHSQYFLNEEKAAGIKVGEVGREGEGQDYFPRRIIHEKRQQFQQWLEDSGLKRDADPVVASMMREKEDAWRDEINKKLKDTVSHWKKADKDGNSKLARNLWAEAQRLKIQKMEGDEKIEKGKFFTEDEKIEMQGTALRRMFSGSGGAPYAQGRTMKSLEEKLFHFFETPAEALRHRISNHTRSVAIARTFGPEAYNVFKGDAKPSDETAKSVLMESNSPLGLAVHELKKEGKLKVEDFDKIREMTQSLMSHKPPGDFLRGVKDLNMWLAIGNPISSLKQIPGETALAGAKYGWKHVGSVVAKRLKHGWEKAGLLDISKHLNVSPSYEIANRGDPMGWFAQKLAKYSGFQKADIEAGNILVNSALSKMGSMSEKDRMTWLSQYKDVLDGKDKDAALKSVSESIKNGNYHDENVHNVAYYLLSEDRPTGLASMPLGYLKATGITQVPYNLRGWGLFDLSRHKRNIYDKLKSNDPIQKREALQHGVYLLGAMVLAGAAADQAADWLLGKPVKFTDRVLDNFLKIGMASRYQYNTLTGSRPDLKGTILSYMSTPALDTANAVWKDAVLAAKDDKKDFLDLLSQDKAALRAIPLGIGTIARQRFLGGSNEDAAKNVDFDLPSSVTKLSKEHGYLSDLKEEGRKKKSQSTERRYQALSSFSKIKSYYVKKAKAASAEGDFDERAALLDELERLSQHPTLWATKARSLPKTSG